MFKQLYSFNSKMILKFSDTSMLTITEQFIIYALCFTIRTFELFELVLSVYFKQNFDTILKRSLALFIQYKGSSIIRAKVQVELVLLHYLEKDF